MPFGITSASKVLQKWTYKTFGDIPNVHIVADDMLITAKTEAEHDSTLRKVMERARGRGVKFNYEDAVEEIRSFLHGDDDLS